MQDLWRIRYPEVGGPHGARWNPWAAWKCLHPVPSQRSRYGHGHPDDGAYDDAAPSEEDEPFWMLLSTFVDSVTITISVTEGESAMLEVFYGRAVDPDDPTLGVDVVDPLETVEVGSEPITVELP